jgi:uncharacterized protein YdhG (YjbR/CyaY superfamily)
MQKEPETKFKTVDEYINSFPEGTREKLEAIRFTIKKAAPGAEEFISYNMPAYRQGKMLAYFAAQKNHIGFYPGVSGIENFKKEIADYKWSKGTVQLPKEKPLPLDLIDKIIRFRVEENLSKQKSKTKRP